jgi:hypothetical protein
MRELGAKGANHHWKVHKNKRNFSGSSPQLLRGLLFWPQYGIASLLLTVSMQLSSAVCLLGAFVVWAQTFSTQFFC